MTLPCKTLTGITLILIGILHLQTVNGQDDSLAGSFLSGKLIIIHVSASFVDENIVKNIFEK